MSRPPSPVLAYDPATRRAYLFPGQTQAARWLIDSGRCKGTVNTARSNLLAFAVWPRNPMGGRMFHGFAWVRGEPDAPVAVLMDKLVRRLRIWALQDADWGALTDAELCRAMSAAHITDPAHEPTPAAPLASGVRLMDGLPD